MKPSQSMKSPDQGSITSKATEQEHISPSLMSRENTKKKATLDLKERKPLSKLPEDAMKPGTSSAVAMTKKSPTVKANQGNVLMQRSTQKSQASSLLFGDAANSSPKQTTSTENFQSKNQDQPSAKMFMNVKETQSTSCKENRRVAHTPTSSATNRGKENPNPWIPNLR